MPRAWACCSLAAKEYEYNLNFGEIARIWRGGCIIRARFLNDIRRAFERDPSLANLLLDPEFCRGDECPPGQPGARWLRWRLRAASRSLAFSSALAYFDAYRSERLPANLTQAQRDYFGAHTYRRIDRPGHRSTRSGRQNRC